MADRDDVPETRPVPLPSIGSYRLVEPLGSGGMSSVFRAVHKETGHEVAVKVLPRYLAKNPTLLQRFLREAKSAESLEDPNVVAIYDRGSESGRHYLVLEYVPGGDLHDRVREVGPLPIDEAADAVRQVARGLKHAAGRGLIHRDIKPANILRRPDGVVKVTDLGLALQAEDDERVTRDGTTVGTVDYMAPEQARDSRATSLKSDIYSLGCTFYYLLTGTPPFAGGDVAEKLRAHATEPAPDVREVRPGVPAPLAKLVRKMMAKRPEKRFADYDELLAALDAVSGAKADAPAGPLMALIDDEDEPGRGEAPLMALIDEDDEDEDRTRLPGPAPLMALIDEEDEDDDQGFALGPGPVRSGGTTASTPTLPSGGEAGPLGEVNLSALHGLEEDSPTLPAPPRRPGSTAATPARPGSRPMEPVAAPTPEEAYDLVPPIRPTPHLYEAPPPPSPGVPLATWVVRICLTAIVVMLLAFGWSQFSHYLFEEGPPREGGQAGREGDGAGDGSKSGVPRAVPPLPPWSEPPDAEAAPPKEPPVTPGALARLGMAAAATEPLSRDEAPRVRVRRVDPERDREKLPNLPLAFENLGGTVTVADDGPFFEDALRIAGEDRVLRAGPGYRPVIVLGAPSGANAERPAAAILNGQTLVIEGIDLVVDASALSARQEALFLLKGGSLTLRDCTVTVAGPVRHDYAIVQVGERGKPANERASTVRIERSRLRGEASAVRLAESAKVTIARSAISCAKGSPIQMAGERTAVREVAVYRSILSGRGPLIALIGAAGASDAKSPTVRSFESTYARIAGAEGPEWPLVRQFEPPPGPPRAPSKLVDWRGETDSFVGWSAWSSGSPPGVLAGLRGADPDAERSGREVAEPWPAGAGDPWSEEIVPLALAKTVTIAPPKLALPAADLRERTLSDFAKRTIPPDPGGPAVDLAFDADGKVYSGDLGRFLAEKRPPTASRLRVRVTGSGRHDMTPLRLPEGVSLEIRVEPVGPGKPPVTWTTPDEATDEALIAVTNATLDLTGVRLTGTPKSHIAKLIEVHHGRLHVRNSFLMGPAGDEAIGGRLIEFRTDGTRPFPDGASQRARGGERPACVLEDTVLMTGGDAIAAEVGRGVVALRNCAIMSGSTALVLAPLKVRRDRFDADLILDRCTIAAVENIARLRAWPGLPPGPDRPWVVRSTGCVFSDNFERTQALARGVMLRTEPEGLARSLLAWESSHDVFDLTTFTAGGEIAPTALARSDIRRGWIDLWGPSHVEAPSGFTTKGGEPAARFLIGRLKPLDLNPGDLALDPSYPPGRKGLDVGADLGAMGVAPSTPKPKPSGR